MDDRNQQGALIVKAAAKSTFLILLCSTFCFAPSAANAQNRQRPSSPPQGRQATRPQVQPRTPPANHTQQAPRRSGPVAVVDLNEIFKNHVGFKNAMDNMKKEVQRYEESLRARHQELAKKRDELQQYRPGTKDYETRERALADATATLSVDTQLKKKEFLEREARVYYQVYNEVTNVIRAHANMYGISLVLRYNGEPINPEDRNSVLAGVNRAIVYQNSLDITPEIVDRINRMVRKPRGTTQR